MHMRTLSVASTMVALAGAASAQLDEPFPAVFDVELLRAQNGGDGSLGFILHGESSYDYSGVSVDAAGDINGDGFNDIVVGATEHVGDFGDYYSGMAYVIFGRATNSDPEFDLSSLDGSNGFVLTASDEASRTGFSVAGGGDVNGDGVDDLLVGAPYFHNDAGRKRGNTYVVFGRLDGFPAAIDLEQLDGENGFRIEGSDQARRSGHSVDFAGDVNGDGIDDVIIGTVNPELGHAYVVFGRDTGFPPVLSVVDLDGDTGFRMDRVVPDTTAILVSRAGDVNADGVADLLIGAPGTSPEGRRAAGEAYVVFGRTSGFPASFDLESLDGSDGFRVPGTRELAWCGESVDGAGDINGDGVDDVIISSPRGGPEGDGVWFVIFGRRTPFPPSIDPLELDGTDGFRIESAVFPGPASGLNDINGDGISDLAASTTGGANVHVVYGSRDPFPAAIDVSTLDGTNGFRVHGTGQRFGASIASGDTNGDGASDLIIGSPRVDFFTGESFVVYGRLPGCPADLDGDGDTDADDFFAYLDAFAAGDLDICDIDADGDCDAEDFFGYLDLFAAGC